MGKRKRKAGRTEENGDGAAVAVFQGKDQDQDDAFPWERQPSESVQAFARFLSYRDFGPQERSLVKVAKACQISEQLVSRWSKRWQWVKRSVAYDAWLQELGDGLGKSAVLQHRARLVRLSSASLTKATLAATKLNVMTLDAGAIAQLAKVGRELGDAALGTANEQVRAAPAIVHQTSVQFGLGLPSWASANEIKPNQNEIVVGPREQVIAELNAAAGANAGASGSPGLPGSQGTPPMKRLKERLIEAPVRIPE